MTRMVGMGMPELMIIGVRVVLLAATVVTALVTVVLVVRLIERKRDERRGQRESAAQLGI